MYDQDIMMIKSLSQEKDRYGNSAPRAIERFDWRLHGPDALARQGTLLVPVAYDDQPEIRPGTQLRVVIPTEDPEGRPLVGENHLTYATPSPRLAATMIVQQVAYNSGLGPGHGSYHFERNQGVITVESLASPTLKDTLEAYEKNAPYIGFACLADASKFADPSCATAYGARPTAGHAAIEGMVGFTYADLNDLMGPQGIGGLRDPADHPIVRQQFLLNGIRPDAFA